MIYTLTLNPAIDYVIGLDVLRKDDINRTLLEEIYFGGKGINVSLILNELKVPSTALGFVAGFTGDAIEKDLETKGIVTDFIHVAHGNSRINVKIRTMPDGKTTQAETQLNGAGPEIDGRSLRLLIDQLERIRKGDYIVLAGSIPPGVPRDIYELIAEKLSPRGVKIVVDATGDVLKSVLKYKPFLAKPNKTELGDFFGVTINNADEAELYARKLQEMGARNALISMGTEGAIFVDEEGRRYDQDTLQGQIVNTVGAGDSLTAGFLAGLESDDIEYALRLACAAGTATAFSPGLGDARKIREIVRQF